MCLEGNVLLTFCPITKKETGRKLHERRREIIHSFGTAHKNKTKMYKKTNTLNFLSNYEKNQGRKLLTKRRKNIHSFVMTQKTKPVKQERKFYHYHSCSAVLSLPFSLH